MLKRKIYSRIEEYLKNPSHKMLLVDGARQIGKSFIIRHIGQMLYPNYIEVNMEEDKQGDRIFANARTTKDFYLALSASRHKEIFVSSPAPHRCGGFSLPCYAICGKESLHFYSAFSRVQKQGFDTFYK